MTSAADIAFSPAVRAAQARKGSAAAMSGRVMADHIGPEVAAFIAAIDTAYLGTTSVEEGGGGQPYIQHRGGPPGFLQVLDERTIGFADFKGNKQFITTGNLDANPKAFLFLMDYTHRRRVKLWGRAHVSDDAQMVARLMPDGYRARPEQAVLFEVTAVDINCPQHIPKKLPAATVQAALDERDARIAALEAEVEHLRRALDGGRATEAAGGSGRAPSSLE